MTQEPQDDPIERFKRLQKQAASDDPIERFKALKAAAESTGHGTPKPVAGDSDFTRRPIAAESTGALSQSRPNASGDFEASLLTQPKKLAGSLLDTGENALIGAGANAMKVAGGFPGGKAAQAGFSMMGNALTGTPQSYEEARKGVQDVEGEYVEPGLGKIEEMAGAVPAVLSGGRAAITGAKTAGDIAGIMAPRTLSKVRKVIKLFQAAKGAKRVTDAIAPLTESTAPARVVGTIEGYQAPMDAIQPVEGLTGNAPPELSLPAAAKDQTEVVRQLARTRHATRARMNADAERMGLPSGPEPPQGRVRAPDPADMGIGHVVPQPMSLAEYLQARMRNPSLPRPTPDVLRSLGITP